jgi:pyridoxine/pyridoxamine 5'-phosphate oxidase
MLFTHENTPAEIWKTLVHELHRGALDSKHPFRYVNLGTNGKDYPEVRTIVLRKVDTALNCLVYTDFRSAKVEEILANPLVLIHFYNPKQRVQLRIQAKAIIHHQDSLTPAYWSQVQGDAQKAYNSTNAPGSKIEKPEQAYEWAEEMDSQFFAVLELVPQAIEALQLDGLNHLRINFSKKQENWEGEWLVP